MSAAVLRLARGAFRPWPRPLAHVVSAVVVLAWIFQMGALLTSVLGQGPALAADLGRYGAGAQWKGVYYKGDKIGFVVGQTTTTDDGFELLEDGRLQMRLLGASTAARVRTVARVDKAFTLRSFSFSLDPGTGAVEVSGRVEGKTLHLAVTNSAGRREETRELSEVPALSLNLPRRMAAAGLAPGLRLTTTAFDPATLRNAEMQVAVEAREVVWAAGRPVPAFRVKTSFSGISATSWITDVGEVVKEESPAGLMVIRETRERAMALAVSGEIQDDLLETAAVVPSPPRRIDDNAQVEHLRVRLEGASGLDPADLDGAGQTVSGDEFDIRRSDDAAATPRDPAVARFLLPETFVESDAPEIVAEAEKAARGATLPRARAEKLVRYVNALLDKKPTVSLPSAREVLRTRVGDCNEHTVLYVAMARALALPARIAVGLVHVQGAFYYHAWAEVYVETAPGRGAWLPADPTLNQFPADATHIRLARGGLDKQAVVMPLVGHLKMRILDLKLASGATPILVGRTRLDTRPLELNLPRRGGSGATCWSRPD